MKERSYTIKGTRPVLQHNERLADPLNQWAKELKRLAKKRNKTDEDHVAVSRAEFMGGLYIDEKGPYVPEQWLEACLRGAAKQTKRGKAVQSALIVTEPARLEYKGPRGREDLWRAGSWSEDGAVPIEQTFVLRATVGVSGARVIRSRPMFSNWGITFTVNYDENVLDATEIDSFVEIGGRLIGIGDWRPKFGRFVITAIDGKER